MKETAYLFECKDTSNPDGWRYISDNLREGLLRIETTLFTKDETLTIEITSLDKEIDSQMTDYNKE